MVLGERLELPMFVCLLTKEVQSPLCQPSKIYSYTYIMFLLPRTFILLCFKNWRKISDSNGYYGLTRKLI